MTSTAPDFTHIKNKGQRGEFSLEPMDDCPTDVSKAHYSENAQLIAVRQELLQSLKPVLVERTVPELIALDEQPSGTFRDEFRAQLKAYIAHSLLTATAHFPLEVESLFGAECQVVLDRTYALIMEAYDIKNDLEDVALAEIRWALASGEDVESFVADMVTRCPSHPFLAHSVVNLALDSNSLDVGIRWAQNHLKYHPTDTRMKELYAYCHWSKGDIDAAARINKEALKEAPFAGRLWELQSEIYAAQGQELAASECADTAQQRLGHYTRESTLRFLTAMH